MIAEGFLYMWILGQNFNDQNITTVVEILRRFGNLKKTKDILHSEGTSCMEVILVTVDIMPYHKTEIWHKPWQRGGSQGKEYSTWMSDPVFLSWDNTCCCCSVIKSCPTVCDPMDCITSSLSPGVCWNSCPLSQWCHWTISSSDNI